MMSGYANRTEIVLSDYPSDIAGNRLSFGMLKLPMFVLALSLVASAASACDCPNGFPTNPNFFPIGVWLQSPSRAPSYKAIGINTYVGLWDGPQENQLAILAKNHMFAIAAQNDI